MEIGKCDCGHPALRYHSIDRHLLKLPDGKQMYSDKCYEPGCRCERARIVKQEANPAIQKEKASWSKVVASILG